MKKPTLMFMPHSIPSRIMPRGRFELYKHCTAVFLKWLASANDDEGGYALDSVKAIARAIEHLAKKMTHARCPTRVRECLRTAIKVRTDVNDDHACRARERARVGDEEESSEARSWARHAYFVAVLRRASAALTSSEDVEDDGGNIATDDDEVELRNAFARLEVSAWENAGEGEAAAEAERDPTSVVGKRVALVGLKSTQGKSLNGKCGLVEVYNADKDQYGVRLDSQPKTLIACARMNVSERVAAEEEERLYAMGEDLEFRAMCLVVDIKDAISEVEKIWTSYANGDKSLLECTALTNAVARHVEQLSLQAEGEVPEFSSLLRVVVVAYMSDCIEYLRVKLKLSYADALTMCVSMSCTHRSEQLEFMTQPFTGLTSPLLMGTRLYAKRPGCKDHDPECLQRIVKSIMNDCDKLLNTQDVLDATMHVAARASLLFAPQWWIEANWKKGKRSEEVLSTNINDSTMGEHSKDKLVGGSGILHTAMMLFYLENMNVLNRKLTDANGQRPSPCKIHSRTLVSYDSTQVDHALPAALCVIDYAFEIFSTANMFMGGPTTSPKGDISLSDVLSLDNPLGVNASKFMTLRRFFEQYTGKSKSKHGHSVAFVFACHAMLLSTVCTAGNNKCERVLVCGKESFKKAIDNLGETMSTYERYGTKNVMQASKNLQPIHVWLHTHEMVMFNSFANLWRTPWFTGQLLLILNAGLSLNLGMYCINERWQISAPLHMYNALQKVGVMTETIELLDRFANVLKRSEAYWYASEAPNANFEKCWCHVTGMSIGGSHRKLIRASASEYSVVFKRICDEDFSDIAISNEEESLSIRAILDAISTAFAEDEFFGTDFLLLSAKLAPVLGNLIETLGVGAVFETERKFLSMKTQSQLTNSKTSRAKDNSQQAKIDQGSDFHASVNATVHLTLARCERHLSLKDQPLSKVKIDTPWTCNPNVIFASTKFRTREELNAEWPLTTDEIEFLQRVGHALKREFDALPACNFGVERRMRQDGLNIRSVYEFSKDMISVALAKCLKQRTKEVGALNYFTKGKQTKFSGRKQYSIQLEMAPGALKWDFRNMFHHIASQNNNSMAYREPTIELARGGEHLADLEPAEIISILAAFLEEEDILCTELDGVHVVSAGMKTKGQDIGRRFKEAEQGFYFQCSFDEPEDLFLLRKACQYILSDKVQNISMKKSPFTQHFKKKHLEAWIEEYARESKKGYRTPLEDDTGSLDNEDSVYDDAFSEGSMGQKVDESRDTSRDEYFFDTMFMPCDSKLTEQAMSVIWEEGDALLEKIMMKEITFTTLSIWEFDPEDETGESMLMCARLRLATVNDKKESFPQRNVYNGDRMVFGKNDCVPP